MQNTTIDELITAIDDYLTQIQHNLTEPVSTQVINKLAVKKVIKPETLLMSEQ